MEFSLAHHARQAKQQPVVIEARVMEAFAVGNKRAEVRAKLEQLMPITVIPGQAGGIPAHYQPNAGQSDFGNQVLEAGALLGRGARLAQVLVYDFDPLPGPASCTARSTRRYCRSVLSP